MRRLTTLAPRGQLLLGSTSCAALAVLLLAGDRLGLAGTVARALLAAWGQ